MFREMRRSGQALPDEEIDAVLARESHGVLAVQGDGGYPYAVPLNYVREGDHLYFHIAMEGHKLDALKNSDKASFCVIGAAELDMERLTTHYRSVIAFGRLSLVADEAERRRLIRLLCEKFAPYSHERFDYEMVHYFPNMHILDLHMEHVTGKEEKTMAAERRKRVQA
ncbi:MAG: pyridoxamine 5'-phosphate oxidase family protein [Desulfovibrionaceae bacterium]|nr:pyridoxamine 5'-phosphate oxidase family protein [Desulfovibrionaceae bacterium]